MVNAVWKKTEIAASNETVVVEGNHYFPLESINPTFLEKSSMKTHCPWKGDASYYHVMVDGERNENAAWYYAEPKSAAQQIEGKVAFWKGIQVG